MGGGENSAVLSSGLFSHFYKSLPLTMACVVSELAQALTSLQPLGPGWEGWEGCFSVHSSAGNTSAVLRSHHWAPCVPQKPQKTLR